MQVLSKKTPVATCQAQVGYTGRMLAKYADNPILAALVPRCEGARAELGAAEFGLAAAEERLMLVRVDVGYEDYAADQWLRRLHHLVQMADGHKNGRLCTRLFPDGLQEITKRQGPSQVKRMRDLEDRLAATQDWSDAPAQHTALIVQRTRYEDTIASRDAADREVASARATRDAAKERLLDLFAEIAGVIRSEFPRDRRMQDLFFDTQGLRSSRKYTEEPGEALPEEPGDDTENA
jgi:hypothetical protein